LFPPIFSAILFSELSESVKKEAVTVVDVRNRDEIKETGKIPNSFCVPRTY
jgi:hypothetical protein